MEPALARSRETPEAPPERPTFRALFEAEYSYVCHTARRFGVRDGDLDDVAHDVFVAVHRRLADFEPGRPVRPWLVGITFRIVAAFRRRTQQRHESREEPPDAADERPLADEQIGEGQRRALVLAALESLEPDRRAVFVMHEIDELPMAEIAVTFGIPLNTAYSRLRLARRDFEGAVKRLSLRIPGGAQ